MIFWDQRLLSRNCSSLPLNQATVLDIGTGPFALLAVIAAKAGAKKVYAIEKMHGAGHGMKSMM